jgi:hypothetical protein
LPFVFIPQMSRFALAKDEKPVFPAVCPNEHENVVGSGREAYLLLPVIPADRPGVRTTKPVKHNGNDGQIAR